MIPKSQLLSPCQEEPSWLWLWHLPKSHYKNLVIETSGYSTRKKKISRKFLRLLSSPHGNKNIFDLFISQKFLEGLFRKVLWNRNKWFKQMQNGKMIKCNGMKIKWTMECLFSKMYLFNNMWASTKMSSNFLTKQLCPALSEKEAVLP